MSEEEISFDTLCYRARYKDYVVKNLDKMYADIRMLGRLMPYPALEFIRRSIGYDEYIKGYAEYRQIAADELYEILDELGSMIKDIRSYEELFTFVEEYSEIIKKQYEGGQNGNKQKRGLRLMTMHSSKGLEFDAVYIMNAVEGIIPYNKAKLSSEIEEERRMLYVAMTRARHKLYIFAPKSVSGKPKDVSRFLGFL